MSRTSLRMQKVIMINFALAFICMLGSVENGINVVMLVYMIISSLLMRYVSLNSWKDGE